MNKKFFGIVFMFVLAFAQFGLINNSYNLVHSVEAAGPESLIVKNITSTTISLDFDSGDMIRAPYTINIVNISVPGGPGSKTITLRSDQIDENGIATMNITGLNPDTSYNAKLSNLKDGLINQTPAFKTKVAQISITSFTPIEGEVGDTVTITGENITSVDKVLFGSVEVSSGNIKPITINKLSIVVPVGAVTGAIKIQTQNNGTATSASSFKVVSASSVNLSIKNITSDSADVVFKENIEDRPYKATVVNKADDKDYKTLSATTNQIVNGVVTMKATGLKPGSNYLVKITNNVGVSTEASFATLGSSNSTTGAITDFNPKSGVVDTEVIISGNNFIKVDYVLFGSGKAVALEKSTTALKVKVPANATTGKITIKTETNDIVSSADFTVGSTAGGTGAGVGSGTTVAGTSVATNSKGEKIGFKGLVPDCNTGEIDKTTGHYKNPCDFTYFMAFINNFIKFLLFDIALPIVALIIMYTGYLFLTAGGSAGQTEKAKHVLGSVIFGYLIALSAWLIITAILGAFEVTDPLIGTFIGK